MYYRNIFRIIGIFVILFSITMIIPIIISLMYIDNSIRPFFLAFLIIFSIGFVLWLPNKNKKVELNNSANLLLSVLFWIVLGSLGALPFLFSKVLNLSITDAFFESFSGFTTTGATILVGLDYLPKSILFYRQMLQWLGGIGIISLAVIVCPLLNFKGAQLYRFKMLHIIQKNQVISIKTSEISKKFLFIYIFLTIICTISLWISGMSFFDAVSHSFSTVSVGGFSTHDASISYFHSLKINFVVYFFLFLSSLNYSLHFLFLSGRSIFIYWSDLECRVFIIFQLFLLCLSIFLLFNSMIVSENFIFNSFFQLFSWFTTAGFSIISILNWPENVFILLFFFVFIGGCSGSISGGFKIIRFLLSFKKSSYKLNYLVNPYTLYNVKINNEIISTRFLGSVLCFFFIL